MGGVRLDCPFCGTAVIDGDVPDAPVCPGCAAWAVGDRETPREAVEALAERLAIRATGCDTLLAALFGRDSADPDAPAAVTSDRRDGFYRWWVFVTAAPGGDDRVRALAGPTA